MTAETPETNPETPLETLSDRALLLRIARVADHLDGYAHDTHAKVSAVLAHIDRAAPLLDRFAHPGKLFTAVKGRKP